jgi:hypothetical protein
MMFSRETTGNGNGTRRPKIVLLVLSGDPAQAREKLAAEYPHALIELVPRGEVQGGGFAKRLRTFRALHPDVFAIATERLSWQRGQNPLHAVRCACGCSRRGDA